MELKTVELNILDLAKLKKNIDREKLVLGAFTEREEAEDFKVDTDIIKEVIGIFFVMGDLGGKNELL